MLFYEKKIIFTNSQLINKIWYIKIPENQYKFNGLPVKHFFSEIISNDLISKDFYRICFKWDRNVQAPEPGQFLTILVSESYVPLLRRPFALSDYKNSARIASVIYKKRGIATEILAGKNNGDKLDIIGPLGNSFKIDGTIEDVIVVAGGIGLGPMLYTANCIRSMGKNIKFVFGANNKLYIPGKEIFNLPEPIICTDDGSQGFKGTTVDFLLSLDSGEIKGASVFACGPLPMLKGCHDFAQKNKLHCHVLMEQIMACGVGACMGCVIKVKREPGYERVCAEGAIFNSKDVVWT